MVSANVKFDDRALKSANKQIQRAAKKSTARAINETLVNARSTSIKETAKAKKLPQKPIRSRLTRSGQKKGDRARLTRARQNKLSGGVTVYMRGIPVYQVSGAQTKRGVKAKGGRLYEGAFYPRNTRGPSRYGGLVFKRQGRARTPLMMPKIGVRQILDQKFTSKVAGREGQQVMRQRFNRLMQFNLNKVRT